MVSPIGPTISQIPVNLAKVGRAKMLKFGKAQPLSWVI